MDKLRNQKIHKLLFKLTKTSWNDPSQPYPSAWDHELLPGVSNLQLVAHYFDLTPTELLDLLRIPKEVKLAGELLNSLANTSWVFGESIPDVWGENWVGGITPLALVANYLGLQLGRLVSLLSPSQVLPVPVHEKEKVKKRRKVFRIPSDAEELFYIYVKEYTAARFLVGDTGKTRQVVPKNIKELAIYLTQTVGFVSLNPYVGEGLARSTSAGYRTRIKDRLEAEGLINSHGIRGGVYFYASSKLLEEYPDLTHISSEIRKYLGVEEESLEEDSEEFFEDELQPEIIESSEEELEPEFEEEFEGEEEPELEAELGSEEITERPSYVEEIILEDWNKDRKPRILVYGALPRNIQNHSYLDAKTKNRVVLTGKEGMGKYIDILYIEAPRYTNRALSLLAGEAPDFIIQFKFISHSEAERFERIIEAYLRKIKVSKKEVPWAKGGKTESLDGLVCEFSAGGYIITPTWYRDACRQYKESSRKTLRRVRNT